jgi:hypothetical protein
MMKNKPKKKPATGGAALPSDDTVIPVDSALYSQKELRELSFEISARCFSKEPAPRLTLSAVHPWRIHAYWHITSAMMKQAMEVTKTPHALVIRFADLTPGQISESSEEAIFDIEVDGLDNNWYIDMWQPGKRYVAELGLRGTDNTLHVFVRSNEIQVPRAEPSPTLEFNLAQYKGAKPIAEAQSLGESTYSVARLTNLLPPFKSFPDVRSDAANQILNEPEFPNAPLSRVQAWGVEPTIEDGATPARERYRYGSSFPTPPVETINESSAYVTTETTSDAPIDYKAVPVLPEIDPRTVSESNMEFTAARRPECLELGVSSTGNTENSTDKKEIQATTFNKVFPDVRADAGHLDTNDSVSPLSTDAIDSDILGSVYFTQATSLPEDKIEEINSFLQIYSDELDAYPMEEERLESPLKNTPYIDLPTPPSSRTLECNERSEDIDSSISAPATLIDQMNVYHRAPAGPAPKPVVALEEAIAESFFSATTDEAGLSLSVQLELSGKSSSDQILALFGESVHVDEQGRFSVRIKLDKGPQLAALLRAQRKNILGGH